MSSSTATASRVSFVGVFRGEMIKFFGQRASWWLVALALLVLPLAGAADTSAVTPVATMTVARAVHTATTLADGRVLVVGGCTTPGCELDGSEGAVAELYDPEARRFARTGSLNEWRDDHTATLLRDGRVLVAGGWSVGGVLASSELFDPRTETFAVGPVMGSRRAGMTAIGLRTATRTRRRRR